jgi:hypothetical protein
MPNTPTPAPQEPVRDPEGCWEPNTQEKNDQAGISPPPPPPPSGGDPRK